MTRQLAVRVSALVVLAFALVAAVPVAAQNWAEVVWEETWLPGSLACGQRVTARVTMRNVGATTWTNDVYKLGPVDDSDELNGPARVYIESAGVSEVAPGEQVTFEFELQAPGATSVRWTDWQMVHEGVEWFGEVAGQQVEVVCAAPVDGAQVVATNLPSSLECGQFYQASVTMKNTGTTTWSEAELYRLGAVGDADDLGGPGRVLMGGGQVPPGGQYTFSFELYAPDQANPAALTDWRMVHDGVAWFGGIAAQTVAVACTPPTDDAQVIAVNLPTSLECGQVYMASVTMRNTGTTTWTPDVYKLGAAGDGDDQVGRPDLPERERPRPGRHVQLQAAR
jgi:hypothetical protein